MFQDGLWKFKHVFFSVHSFISDVRAFRLLDDETFLHLDLDNFYMTGKLRSPFKVPNVLASALKFI